MGQRIGILGGSFDPIHAGHIHAAREARRLCGLDRVVLVPARVQPLKQSVERAPAADRLAMLRLALAAEGDPALEASDVELHRDGPSYTVDTLEALARGLGPDVELWFIAGADVLDTLPRWFRLDDVLRLARFVVVARPGHRPLVPAALAARVEVVESEPRAVSSTEIRRRLAASAAPLAGLLAAPVEAYIRARGLYGAVRAVGPLEVGQEARER